MPRRRRRSASAGASEQLVETLMSKTVENTNAELNEGVYKAYRAQIEHEDDLIGLRVGWFIATEAFLFAAYGVVVTVQSKPILGHALSVERRLLEAVPIVGILMAVLVGFGIGAAMHRLRLLHARYQTAIGHVPPDYPSLWAEPTVIFFGHLASALITPIVIVSWIFVWQGRDEMYLWLPILVLITLVGFGIHWRAWHKDLRKNRGASTR